MSTLQKFQEWSDQHHTHVNRHINILNRQAESLRSYVELIKNRPVDSTEFLDEIQKLHHDVVDLVDELAETNIGFIEDCDRFRDILDFLKQDFLRVAGK